MSQSDQKPIVDLPTGAPLPSGLPPPSKPPKDLPIGALLSAAPSNLDAFLAHLHRCLQTPSGIDTVLLFVCYTSRLSAWLLDVAARNALQRSARKLLVLLLSIPPQSIIVKPAAGPQLSARLRALAGMLAEARTFMRLWGLLGMYFWGKRLVAKEMARGRSEKKDAAKTHEETLDRAIAWTQLTSCVLFQVLENAAFLAQKKVLVLDPRTHARTAKWSTRFWCVYIGTELGRLLVEKARKQGGGEKLGKDEHRAWRERWNKDFLRNLAWYPLTLSGSLEKGFATEAMAGVLGTIPGVIQMADLWKETAVKN